MSEEFKAPYTVPTLMCGACGQPLQYGGIATPGVAQATCFTPRCPQRRQRLTLKLPVLTDFEVAPVKDEA